MRIVFYIDCWASEFLGFIEHRLFYIELHTVSIEIQQNSSIIYYAPFFLYLITHCNIYRLLSSVVCIFYYATSFLPQILVEKLYIQLHTVYIWFSSMYIWLSKVFSMLYFTMYFLYPPFDSQKLPIFSISCYASSIFCYG